MKNQNLIFGKDIQLPWEFQKKTALTDWQAAFAVSLDHFTFSFTKVEAPFALVFSPLVVLKTLSSIKTSTFDTFIRAGKILKYNACEVRAFTPN